jgi:hypothetical protein
MTSSICGVVQRGLYVWQDLMDSCRAVELSGVVVVSVANLAKVNA